MKPNASFIVIKHTVVNANKSLSDLDIERFAFSDYIYLTSY